MVRLLLLSILFTQIPVRPTEGGTITGILKSTEGKPAVGVRIAAVAQPDATLDTSSVATMSSLGETDLEGRFRLDMVPPGRYYIAAGRLDVQSYYPGTTEMAMAKEVVITPGSTVSGIDFTLSDFSIGRADGAAITIYRNIPVQIRVDNGARLPIYSTKGQTLVWLTRSDNVHTGLQMTGKVIRLPIPSPTVAGEFRATVANLPEGYAVKAMMFGPDNVTSSAFKVASGTSTGPLLTVELTTIPLPPAPDQGVRVTGSIPNAFSVYLSGMPANLYSDGTFEFRNVLPGRHAIAVPDTAMSSSLAASIVVGDRDIEGVRLVDTPVLPFAPRAPATPAPAGNHPAGVTIPLASLRGIVIDQRSNRPITEGKVILTSFTNASYSIGMNGEFAIPRLFPGNYNLQIQVSGRTVVSRKVTIGDEDVNLELIVGAI